MRASITLPRRSRNGSRRAHEAAGALKAGAIPFLAKLLLRKSVLIAIGLGTLVSWWVRFRFFRPKPRRFRLF